MADPLFTKKEREHQKNQLESLEKKASGENFSRYWAERESLGRAFKIEEVKRVQARADEYLNTLIIMVGYRGSKYIDFESAFSQSDSDLLKKELAKADTSENRRFLYTILKALIETPSSWGKSAFARFLRGNGKQKGAKYHGAGMFGVDYGWKGDEVNNLCTILVGESYRDQPYARPLMSHVSHEQIEREMTEADPEFEVIDHGAIYKATRVEKDLEFIQKLCDKLEAKGLAAVPAPKEQKPSEPRKVKVFKAGDVIRRRDLRDLPLPAHVRISIEKQDTDSGQWLKCTIEQVVLRLNDSGHYSCARVEPDKNRAFGLDRFEEKYWLDGAVFLGVWKGSLIKDKELKYNFHYRFPEGNKKLN